MLGFHRRNRSLIPVKDMERLEKLDVVVPIVEVLSEIEEAEEQTPKQRRNLTMIYLLFLADAIMASSLSTQIAILAPSANECLSLNASFLRSILGCAYLFGSATGVFWGPAADRLGRRPLALLGLGAMSTCCLCMGFASTLPAMAGLRFAAGSIGSAVTISSLAMLADLTHGRTARIKAVARLPMIAVCGSLGSFVSTAVQSLCENRLSGIFAKYPGLSGQTACAGLVFLIALTETALLEETLPQSRNSSMRHQKFPDCESDPFLSQSLRNDSSDSQSISIVEALSDDAVAPLPSRIGTMQLLTAPSTLILLASFSMLSLHTSTFETLLPRLSDTASHNGGMGIPCAWVATLTMTLKMLAAIRILRFLPVAAGEIGTLQVYRRLSLGFPVLYVLVPLFAVALDASGPPAIISAVFSTLAMLAEKILAGAAQVLVLLLVMSAAPDASSTGAVIGVLSISELFKALVVGASGVSYYLPDQRPLVAVNGSLWAALAVTATIGAAITGRLRETPRVGTDIPEECVVWQSLFDVDHNEEAGFSAI